jgi:hypothetical protein
MLFATSHAYGNEHVLAKVSLVESSYMPGLVTFMLTNGTATCPAGKWLVWQRDADNNKAIYAMLVSALIGGKQIRVFFTPGDASCVPKFMHLVD